MLLLNGIPILLYALISKNGLRKKNSYALIDGIVAGVLAILGYGLVVWSMQFIEIAYVSSIREVSIVLATILSVYLLKEKEAKKLEKKLKKEADMFFDKGLPFLESAYAINPKDKNTLLSLKQLYYMRGDYKKSEDIKRQISQL